MTTTAPPRRPPTPPRKPSAVGLFLRRTLVVLAGIVLGFAAGGLAGVVAAWYAPRPAMPGPAPVASHSFASLLPGPRTRTNILILGQDVSYHGVPARSDTMLLVSLDPTHHAIHVLSIPRDSRVPIPGHGVDKINAALAIGGPRLSEETVREFLGVPVDHYVLVNLEGLDHLVDLIGGVDLYVDRNMYYTDRAAGLYIRLHKGWQHLDGQEAHEFIRFRHDVLGDIMRVQRQQRFLEAVQTKLLQPTMLLKLPFLVQGVMQNVQTDLSYPELLEWASWAKGIGKGQVRMVTLPGRFSGNQYPVSYWLVDPRQAHAIAAALLTDEATPALPIAAPVQAAPGEAPQVNSGYTGKRLDQVPLAVRGDTHISVLNGTRVPGLGEQAAALLRSDGWTVWVVADDTVHDRATTEIVSQSGKDDLAGAVAQSLGLSPRMTASTVGDVSTDFTVKLGQDFLQALRSPADHR